ncbi:efflux transporter outer membrane subunit [Silvimonas amylolytica]|nr:efflux transporter outer membrane subunit [Silvimonas amylolytica]
MRVVPRHFLVVPLVAMIAGCAVGPDFKSPDAPAAQRYNQVPVAARTVSSKGLDGAAQQIVAGQVQDDWWALFGSDKLNALVAEGLAHSPNLDQLKATLRQAQENYNAQYGSTVFPQVDGSLSASRNRISAATSGTGGSYIYNLYNASVNVSYTLDIFGGNRRELESSAAQVDSQQFQLEAARLTLAGNIVTAAITEASLRKQVEVTKQLVDLQQSQLDILQKQFKLGAVSQADVSTQQTQVATIKASLPDLNKSLAQARTQLAVLLGRTPDNGTPELSLEDLQLPTNLPVSLPSELVRARPDIQASEALVHAATAQVGVATANLYPKITLTGSLGLASQSFKTVSFGNDGLWSIGAGLAQPLFHGGSLRAQKRAAEAGLDASLAQYRQVVLNAFKNVSDSLQALDQDALALQARVDAADAAKRSLDFTQARFKLGGTSFASLLISQLQYQQTQLNMWTASATRLTDTAALFQSVGGPLKADGAVANAASAPAAGG